MRPPSFPVGPGPVLGARPRRARVGRVRRRSVPWEGRGSVQRRAPERLVRGPEWSPGCGLPLSIPGAVEAGGGAPPPGVGPVSFRCRGPSLRAELPDASRAAGVHCTRVG